MAKPETQTELLHRRYRQAMKALSDFQTDVSFFYMLDSPIDYVELCTQIDQLKKDFQANVFFVLPSARIL